MKGFMDFLKQTNALALAIGVIIGGAVGKVVSSLAGDILMPLISMALPAGDWREAKIALTHKADGTIDKAIALGSFGGAIVDFVIIAFVVYMITKNVMKPAPAAPAPATKNCPECTEAIPVAAKRCKFCGSAV
jgi:large conductance mechanosensitive channel